MYINFMNFPKFVDAVAGDGLSFDKKVFVEAGALLVKQNLLRHDKSIQFNSFIDNVASKAVEVISKIDVLGDIPDEFLDALMFTLMKDPVKLPSGNIVDRETIERHLLSTANDPFSRRPLTKQELVPDTELKEKIEAFIKSKRR